MPRNLKTKIILIIITVGLLPLVGFQVQAAGTSNITLQINPAPQCYDGVDNDGDGETDYPDDPDCSSTSDNSEAGSGGGGGGGGGGGAPPPAVVTSISFSGRAYPNQIVTLLKDAQVASSTFSGSDGTFGMSLSNISGGSYLFSLYSEDQNKVRSGLNTFPVVLSHGSSVNVSGIFIAPTIDIDKTQVKKGETLSIFGQTVPNASVEVVVNSSHQISREVRADSNGIYLHNLNTSPLELGQHSAKSRAETQDNWLSGFSTALNFQVGNVSLPSTPASGLSARGDLNSDNRINLVDFSITAFWYKRVLSETVKVFEREKLNNDGKIDLIDFSIIAYYWTG